ncbi:MAG: hypothetical protein KGP27_05795 [Hyphomicrobiales bacterium]|nr:hypothetical protein [Hyphomicrobiales bacterium]
MRAPPISIFSADAAAALLAVVLIVLAPVIAVAQQPPTGGAWSQGTDVRILPPGGAAAPKAAPAPSPNDGARTPANTTVVPRAGAEARQVTQVALTALLTDEGQAIDSGLTWRIFRDRAPGDGQVRLVSEHREAAPVVRLEAGDYVVNVAFGRANLTRRISVKPGNNAERFVLNAGGLRLAAQLASGEPAPERTVAYDILSEERDQFGERHKVMTGARPGLIIRLNAGIYQIVSTYGDANATVRADVTVEPGKLTEATVVHDVAKVTFKLVTRSGGEALAEAQWSIAGANGETVKESAGALPTHVLAPGTYTVNARFAGQVFSRQFSVRAGDTAEIEVVTR